MARRIVALAAGTVALAVAGIATVIESPAPRWPEPSAIAREPERVQIEHEFVRIPVTGSPELHSLEAANSKPGGRRAASGALVARTTANTTTANRRTADRPSGVVSRAVQTIIGNGKYRPEPFPKPGR